MLGVIEASDSEFSKHWSTLYANDPIQNPLYMQQPGPLGEADSKHSAFIDRSFLVMAEGEPVFGCSLTTHIDDQGRNCLGYFGLEASTHVNQSTMLEATNNFSPQAIQLLQQHIYQLIEETAARSVDYLDPVSYGIMSPVTQVLLQKGGKPVVHKAQLIELSLSERALYRNIAKNCRAWIEWGRRNLEIEIISRPNFDNADLDYADCFESGAEAASEKFIIPGRLAYEKLAQQGNGFLVLGRYKRKLVSSCLLVHTDRACHLVLAKVFPEAPDRPVLNALVWEAILSSKRRKCSQFHLGWDPTSQVLESSELHSKFSRKYFGGESRAGLVVTLER